MNFQVLSNTAELDKEPLPGVVYVNVPTYTVDCGTDIGREDAAIFHSITMIKHNRYIQKRKATLPVVEATFQLIDIMNKVNTFLPDPITGAPVKAKYLHFPSDLASGVILGIVPSLDEAPTGTFDYSTCLFSGIIAMDNPANFIFNLAIDMRERNTIVFRTTKSNVDNVINFYDLSNVHP